jgi:hypothetical protein
MDVFLFIVGIVLLLAGLFAFLGSARNRLAGVGALTVFTVLAGLCMGGAFTYTLKANEIGLEVARGRIGDAVGPGGNPTGILGTYTKAPWSTVEKFSSLPYTGDALDQTLRTRDGSEFGVRMIPRWHTDAQHVQTLYRQANRTSDEGEITKKIVHLYLKGVAGDVANSIPTDNVVDVQTGKITEFGVANLSTTEFGKRISTKLQPVLEAKGIVLDEIVVDGAINPSDKMKDKLEALAASRNRTQVAINDEATAAAEARAAQARAGSASSVPNLTPQQLAYACAQLWAQEARRATEKGVALYTSPCATAGSAGILVGAK